MTKVHFAELWLRIDNIELKCMCGWHIDLGCTASLLTANDEFAEHMRQKEEG